MALTLQKQVGAALWPVTGDEYPHPGDSRGTTQGASAGKDFKMISPTASLRDEKRASRTREKPCSHRLR